MNTYQIHYLGLLSDRRGLAHETLFSQASTAAELYDFLQKEYSLGLLASQIKVAVNDEFAAWDRQINDQDLIAFLPPMSGG
jgi:molybdopterin converting factor small subunit